MAQIRSDGESEAAISCGEIALQVREGQARSAPARQVDPQSRDQRKWLVDRFMVRSIRNGDHRSAGRQGLASLLEHVGRDYAVVLERLRGSRLRLR